MNSTEFIRKFAREYDVDIEMARDWIGPIFDFMREQIIENDEFNIPRLGNFRHVCILPRQYRDLKTGDIRTSQARMTLEFAVSESLMKEIKTLQPNEALSRSNRKQNRQKPHKKYHAEQDTILSYLDEGGVDGGPDDTI